MNHQIILLLSCLLLSSCTNTGKILITDYGITPGDGQNAVLALAKALEACSEKGISEIIFPRGRYDFYPDKDSKQESGFIIRNLQNVTIEGNGSEFIFHGIMSIGSITGSSNITLRNFSVDWDRPLISQGEILSVTDNSIDIRIDKKEYPYFIEEERIVFTGEDWRRSVEWHNLYDKDTHEIVYQTLDMPLGNDLFTACKTEEITDGVVRIHAQVGYKPQPGTIITLWHGRYIKNGIGLNESKDITLENLNIYHALSNGIVANRTENITMRNVNMTVNEDKKRVFSLVADASHFNTCRGLIMIDDCTHTGQGDDFINIHGMNIKIDRVKDEYSVIIPASGKASSRGTFDTGDEMWFINPQTTQREGSCTIESITEEQTDGKRSGYIVRFSSKLPAGISEGYFMENKSWTPDVLIENCRILKKHRARGILVSTPGKIVIRNNYFRTAGAAILIEGDINYWFESGACTDVLITGNVFEDCLTSKWGDGIIAITPSHRPQGTDDIPYHKNIRITNNTFRHFDRNLVYARSAAHLLFSGNRIERTYNYDPYYKQYGFFLDGCRNVSIKDNIYADEFEGKSIGIVHMKESDVETEDKSLKLFIQ